jgi:hypothetical protein
MTDYDWDEINDIREKLLEYAEYEYDSHTEALTAMCHLAQYPDYISQELWDAIVVEMKAELKNYVDNTTIVTTTVTVTNSVTDLQWNDGSGR